MYFVNMYSTYMYLVYMYLVCMYSVYMSLVYIGLHVCPIIYEGGPHDVNKSLVMCATGRFS
jgi:hypothetical protein